MWSGLRGQPGDHFGSCGSDVGVYTELCVANGCWVLDLGASWRDESGSQEVIALAMASYITLAL